MGTMLDLRRTDLRSNILENPYWITSADISGIGAEADDEDAVLFSFPKTASVSPGYGSGIILIHQMIFECVTTYAAGTCDMLVGVGSIATDAVTTGGTVSDVDVDEYFQTGDITLTTGAFTAPSGGDYFTLMAAFTQTNYATIIPADATVLCIEAQLTSDGVVTAGAGRLHVLISEVPHIS